MNTEIDATIADIRWYISEHGLTDEQLRSVFVAGLQACGLKVELTEYRMENGERIIRHSEMEFETISGKRSRWINPQSQQAIL